MSESEEGIQAFVKYWYLVLEARNSIIEEARESDPDHPFASLPVLSDEEIDGKIRSMGKEFVDHTRDIGVPSMWTTARGRFDFCVKEICVDCTLSALKSNHELVEHALEAECLLKVERRDARCAVGEA